MQYAALALRGEGKSGEVLLITSRETGRWVLPKGWAEAALSGSKLAAKEAFEEAGITGSVSVASLGCYSYEKRLPRDLTQPCTVAVFRMTVECELDDWPERHQRKRQWFTLLEAAKLVDEPELAELLRKIASPAA